MNTKTKLKSHMTLAAEHLIITVVAFDDLPGPSGMETAEWKELELLG